ncbi:Enterobactin biosynthesis protein YbdZ [Pandoraea iniqua]|uniref:Enterobactin biosynthesis protein YbdZ n=1 Tax=Pandoraea iniqua TaxID=2508288 RepID=A0A5E4XIQ8_9BURK|nr:MbtH family NRPS accessory protein [Pandoraea iniqua]VVE06761.1 Enterobactin biosynthesis protein YbdZ [Pandoraea iniqua]VVE36173.1 Enterobactin biosynthesis protein YbdZ [Pandoraea iniqua]
MSWDDENAEFEVVMNHEAQYSIWPSYKAIPGGWHAVGMKGNKAQCLAYIEEHWTDMRPLSLQKAMAEQGGQPASAGTSASVH